MVRDSTGPKGEVTEIRATSGGARIRLDIGSGKIVALGPQALATAFEMKEAVMSRKGVGYVAANGCNIKNYGEKEIWGYTDDGEGVVLRMQRADVKKVLGSAHEINLGGNVLLLDSEGSYTQNI